MGACGAPCASAVCGDPTRDARPAVTGTTAAEPTCCRNFRRENPDISPPLLPGFEFRVDLAKEPIARRADLLHLGVEVGERLGGDHFFLRLALRDERRHAV